ncbi:MAG: putative sulfate exporter family transporter [Litoreibacter sp.]
MLTGDTLRDLFPGVLISGLIALAAQFISEHYGAPAMLMALLFGIALNFLSEEGRCQSGIAFSATTILRFGIALLGVRISFEMAADLGWPIVALVVGSVIATIGFGMLVAKAFGLGARFAFLSAGSVAICGASAAMAISAILPKDDRSEERLVFTVVGVTLLSTIAMILYPILADMIGFNSQLAGVFIGATIHDVAQVVGAGFSISEETGDVATVVKLIRVAMLAPVILVASLILRRYAKADHSTERPPIIPSFVVAFLVLVALNSFGLFPASVIALAAETSRWALLTAIAAVGLKTSLRDVIDVGGAAIALLVVETIFIGGLSIAVLLWLAA